MTRRRVGELVAAAGGKMARRPALATMIVCGHGSAVATLLDSGELAVGFKPAARAAFVSERRFKRDVGMAPAAVAQEHPYAADQIGRLAGLNAAQLRGLALYDVLEPAADRYSYKDLLVARATGRLLSSGVKLGKIAAAALALEERGKSLSGVRLSEAPWGDILQEVDGGLARLDGQLFLPIEGGDIDADAAFARAEASEVGGDMAAAARWYDLAARLDRDDPVIPFNLGNVLDALGRTREAELAYRRAVARAPELPDAWFNLGVLQERTGRTDEALASYGQAYRVEPTYADALHNAALLLMRLRRFAEAVRLWERIAAISPAHAAEVKRLAHLCRLELKHAGTGG